ncbi:peptide deformylase [Arthrobacter sp.]|uniref:peptide deformylase n=1 Tax=Arthrobacter sp. TaxID=1667 RepID=UPI00289C77AD|nr:peptide deformylase [Arthrobacter sp.]
MTVRPIVIHGEPVLHRRAAEVQDFNEELRTLVADMYETMEVSNGVGLAAPQVGVGLRLFTFHYPNDDDAPDLGVVINPVLVTSKVPGSAPDPDDDSEGCLSVPGENFPLTRADWVRISGVDENGAPLQFEATGWFARVLQHEYDHLDGKLYVDRLNERWGRKARKVLKANGWGVPGLSWMPGVDPDPFGH